MGAHQTPAPLWLILSILHTAVCSPFTVYVVTVQKGGNQWQVFRRYKELEELRAIVHQNCGSAPPMPPKQLFGRMRPEVIESRVLGLNHFLQLLLSSPQYASTRELADFLEREMNMPPPVPFPASAPPAPPRASLRAACTQ